jgi:hypothetical protein
MAYQDLPKPPRHEPPVCARCHASMSLVTAISAPKRGGRVRLFECGICQITTLTLDS